MGRFRIALAVGLIGMAAAACVTVSAEPKTRPSSSPTRSPLGPPLSYAGSLTIDPQDSGTRISLGAGNTLVFTLGSQPFPSGLAWGVTTSSAEDLIDSSHAATPPFSFLARRASHLVLKITVGPGCLNRLLGQSQTPCTPGGPPGMPTRLFTYDVTVQSRGG
jgi:hypothetical protein